MSRAAPVTYSQDADGIGWIEFADPAGRAAVFNAATQAALGAAIDEASVRRPRALVITARHERIFIAGADLKWLATLPDPAAATALSRAGQQLFQRVNELGVPVVCAIHGACAGGGFELALACHWRIASDAPVTRIGLPETSIGTIPGWGGCVRLPRLIGIKPALDHILKAQLISAADALAAGLVNEVVPPPELRDRARAAASKLAAGHLVPPSLPPAPVPGYFQELRERTRVKVGNHQPAPLAAIDAVEQCSQLPIPAAFEIEARLFGQVTADEVCKNLIHVFFLRDAAKKRTLEGRAGPQVSDFGVRISDSRQIGRSPGDTHPQSAIRSLQSPGAVLPQRVGVVGAGVMGSGIAQWLAVHGFEVVLRDVQPELVQRGMDAVRALCADGVKRGKLTADASAAALARIRPTTVWDGFDACDLVIEAIVENVAAKQALFAELVRVARPDAVLASNTSALPLEEIGANLVDRACLVGIHFFNPVSRMPLVELILGRETSAASAARALALVKALGKSPVICRSSPGFLVTRVLFFYLNEAVRLWEQGVATAAIDAALRDFGWPMGPLRLIDEVGVDVTDFIFGEMEHYFPERFTRTTACTRMVAAGWKGRKGGASAGFYTYATGREVLNDSETRRLMGRLSDLNLAAADITHRLMRVMTEEAERCLDEQVVESAEDVDFALVAGAGFPPFRGGLLRWAHTTRSGVST